MATIHNGERQKQDLSPQSGVWWVRPLFLGIIGLGFFLLLVPRAQVRSPADKPEDAVARHAPAGAKPSLDPQRMPSLGPADSRFAPGQSLSDPVPSDVWPAGRRMDSPAPPVEPPQHVWELDALVAQFKNTKKITAEGAKDMKLLLRDLRKQGAEAVPAIRDFLRSREDIDFDKMSGGELAEHHTLRQALFDTLRQIGGDEAVAVSLEQLRMTQTPAEIAMLARNLEEAAPGVYRDEAVRIAGNVLQQMAEADGQVDVRPLFELLRDLGGTEAAAVLEQFPVNADAVQYLRNNNKYISPTVRTYALIALADLPDEEGIQGLAALASDPNVPVEHRTEEPFRMLAQASADQVQAGKVLVDLTQAGQIPDRAWSAIADALAGKHLQFPSQLSGGTLPGQNDADLSGVDAPFVRAYYDDEHHIKYEERSVLADWSAKQITQQLTLIDQLIGATHSPAAVQALQQARASLQGGQALSTKP
jgi:HEAT repeat protein